MATPVSLSHMVSLDAAALRGWPLPSGDADKDARGHALVVGGARQMPDALILAATAALRAGAGKLSIATGASVSQLVALAMPEARVIALRETAQGGLAGNALAELDPLAEQVSALLIGPGMQDDAAGAALVRALLARLDGISVVLDAGAMGIILNPDLDDEADPFRFGCSVIVTPHAGEMAHLCGATRQQIDADPAAFAAAAARDWNAVVVLKGPRTVIAAPDGGMWQHDGGNAGLATAGCGDVLAGLIAGLAARGAALAQAACWGVALHALAGPRLADRVGPLDDLARALPDEIPFVLEQAAAT